MQIRQLITVLGFCLSQTRALIIGGPHDSAITSFVELITQPDMAFENTPVFSTIVDNLHQNVHNKDPHQFHHDLHHLVSPLLKDNKQDATYLAESYIGFRQTANSPALREHPQLQADRLQVYRNAIYSLLTALANQNPSIFGLEALEKFRGQLITMLNKKSSAQHSDQSDKYEVLFKELQNEIHSNIPQSKFRFEKLTIPQINQKLVELNRPDLPNVPAPILINGQHFREMLASHSTHSHHHLHQFHAAAPAAKPVTAAA